MNNISNILESKLRSFGVSDEHICFLKKELLEPHIYYDFYDYSKSDFKDLVNVKNIVGLVLRGRSNKTWWEHATYKVGNLEKDRMEKFEINNNLATLSPDERNQIFSSNTFLRDRDNVRLEFFAEENKYFVTNGNHRVTWAKLLNVPKINAEVIWYSFNPIKYQNYIHRCDTKETLERVVKMSSMNLVQDGQFLDVYYKDIYIDGYYHNECLNLSDTDKVNQEIKNVMKIIDKIKIIENVFNRFMKIPEKFRVPVLKFLKVFKKDKENLILIERMIK